MVYLAAIVLSLLAPGAQAAPAATSHVAPQDEAARAVEKMRGTSMQMLGIARGDGRIPPEEQRRATQDVLRSESGSRCIRATGYPQAQEFAARNVLDPPSETSILEARAKAELR
jgi:hypothetical protein